MIRLVIDFDDLPKIQEWPFFGKFLEWYKHTNIKLGPEHRETVEKHLNKALDLQKRLSEIIIKLEKDLDDLDIIYGETKVDGPTAVGP